MIPLLAHGGLGAFDELAFVVVAVIFLLMMVYSAWRSRFEDENDEEPLEAVPPTPQDEHFQLK